MKRYAVVAAAVAVLAGAAVAQDSAADKELQQFQGTWTLESVEIKGVEVPREKFQGSTLVIRGNKMTRNLAGKTYESTFTVDPMKKPKQIDVKIVDQDFEI